MRIALLAFVLAAFGGAPDLAAQDAPARPDSVARNAVTVLFPILLWGKFSGEYARAIGRERTLGVSATWLPNGVPVREHLMSATFGARGVALADVKLHQYFLGEAFRGTSLVLHAGALAHRDFVRGDDPRVATDAARWRVKPTLAVSLEHALSRGVAGDDVVVVGFGVKRVFDMPYDTPIPLLNLSWGGLF